MTAPPIPIDALGAVRGSIGALRPVLDARALFRAQLRTRPDLWDRHYDIKDWRGGLESERDAMLLSGWAGGEPTPEQAEAYVVHLEGVAKPKLEAFAKLAEREAARAENARREALRERAARRDHRPAGGAPDRPGALPQVMPWQATRPGDVTVLTSPGRLLTKVVTEGGPRTTTTRSCSPSRRTGSAASKTCSRCSGITRARHTSASSAAACAASSPSTPTCSAAAATAATSPLRSPLPRASGS